MKWLFSVTLFVLLVAFSTTTQASQTDCSTEQLTAFIISTYTAFQFPECCLVNSDGDRLRDCECCFNEFENLGKPVYEEFEACFGSIPQDWENIWESTASVLINALGSFCTTIETPPTPEEDTPEGDTPEEDTPEEDTPEEDTPEEDTPEEDTPEEDTPDSPPSPDLDDFCKATVDTYGALYSAFCLFDCSGFCKEYYDFAVATATTFGCEDEIDDAFPDYDDVCECSNEFENQLDEVESKCSSVESKSECDDCHDAVKDLKKEVKQCLPSGNVKDVLELVGDIADEILDEVCTLSTQQDGDLCVADHADMILDISNHCQVSNCVSDECIDFFESVINQIENCYESAVLGNSVPSGIADAIKHFEEFIHDHSCETISFSGDDSLCSNIVLLLEKVAAAWGVQLHNVHLLYTTCALIGVDGKRRADETFEISCTGSNNCDNDVSAQDLRDEGVTGANDVNRHSVSSPNNDSPSSSSDPASTLLASGALMALLVVASFLFF